MGQLGLSWSVVLTQPKPTQPMGERNPRPCLIGTVSNSYILVTEDLADTIRNCCRRKGITIVDKYTWLNMC